MQVQAPPIAASIGGSAGYPGMQILRPDVTPRISEFGALVPSQGLGPIQQVPQPIAETQLQDAASSPVFLTRHFEHLFVQTTKKGDGFMFRSRTGC